MHADQIVPNVPASYAVFSRPHLANPTCIIEFYVLMIVMI